MPKKYYRLGSQVSISKSRDCPRGPLAVVYSPVLVLRSIKSIMRPLNHRKSRRQARQIIPGSFAQRNGLGTNGLDRAGYVQYNQIMSNRTGGGELVNTPETTYTALRSGSVCLSGVDYMSGAEEVVSR